MYRRTKIGGADVDQLVLPECKRLEVVQRAHDDVMAGHLACRKTMQRITQCLFFPGMKRRVKEYLTTCEIYTKGREVSLGDEVPLDSVCEPHFGVQCVRFDN